MSGSDGIFEDIKMALFPEVGDSRENKLSIPRDEKSSLQPIVKNFNRKLAALKEDVRSCRIPQSSFAEKVVAARPSLRSTSCAETSKSFFRTSQEKVGKYKRKKVYVSSSEKMGMDACILVTIECFQVVNWKNGGGW